MTGATYQPTAGDLARDQVTYRVAAAYSRLLSPTRADLVAFLAGPRHPVEAHRVAEVIVASTADADLVLLIARLLMAADADEAVEAAAHGLGAVAGASTANNDHPLRRSSDAKGPAVRRVRRVKATPEQLAALANELGVDISGTAEEMADRARACMDASRVYAALAKVGG